MILVRKAVNTPHGHKAALQHLSDAHDAIEQLEKDYINAQNAGAEAAP